MVRWFGHSASQVTTACSQYPETASYASFPSDVAFPTHLPTRTPPLLNWTTVVFPFSFVLTRPLFRCRHFGDVDFAPGLWVGLELDEPVGKNNGTVKDKEYFKCPDRHGIFTLQSRVQLQPRYMIGDRVVVQQTHVGTVRYVGETTRGHGQWIGVELAECRAYCGSGYLGAVKGKMHYKEEEKTSGMGEEDKRPMQPKKKKGAGGLLACTASILSVSD